MHSRPKLLVILLAGVLSVFYAEVLSGSSILWFLDPFGYLVLLPLYMFHLIVLYNFAVMFNRVSHRSLYLFGVLFGLYETWMTKVVWAGFMNSGPPLLGTPLGFAVAEMSIIVFVWHPFMSFIAPILTIQILSIHLGNEDYSCRPWTPIFLSKRRLNWFFYFFFSIFSSSALALNSGGNILKSTLGFLGTLSIVYLLYLIIIRRDPKILTLDNLIVGKKGLAFMLTYLGFLYALFFFFVRTEAIPSLLTILLTFLFYLVIILMLYLDQSPNNINMPNNHSEPLLFNKKDLLRFYLIIYSLTIFLSILRILAFLLTILAFIIIIVTGFIIFTYNFLGILLKHIRSKL
ncbi:MAG: hypothetical protein ACTSVA_04230 [Candidatus Njordarchaeales archaeon]